MIAVKTTTEGRSKTLHVAVFDYTQKKYPPPHDQTIIINYQDVNNNFQIIINPHLSDGTDGENEKNVKDYNNLPDLLPDLPTILETILQETQTQLNKKK